MGITKGVAIALGSVVLILVLGIGLWWAGLIFQRETAGFRGETGAIERTEGNADFRLAAYQKFFNLCSEIQAAEDRIQIFEENLAANPNNSEAQTNLNAARAIRASLVRQYNADATADFTVGQFRDRDLPFRINIDSLDTQCAAT